MDTVFWIVLALQCVCLWSCVCSRKVGLSETSHFCWTPFGYNAHLTESEYDVFVHNTSSHNASCFYLSKKHFGYEHSRNDCRSLGEPANLTTRMVIVRTVEQNAYLTDVLMGSQSTRFNNGVWLGVQWIPHDQRWMWVDGSLLEWENDWGYGESPNNPNSEVCVFLKLDGSWVQGHCNIALNPLYLCEWMVDLSSSTKSTYVPSMWENSTLSRSYVNTDDETGYVGFDNPNKEDPSSSQIGLIVGIAVCVVLGISLSVFMIVIFVTRRRKETPKPATSNNERLPPTSDVRNLTISRPIFNSSTLIRTPRNNIYELEEIPLQASNGTGTIGYLYPVQKPQGAEDQLPESEVYEDIPDSAIYDEPTLDIRGQHSTNFQPPIGLVMGRDKPDDDYEDIDNIKKLPRDERKPLLRFQSPPNTSPPDPPAVIPQGNDEDLVMVDNDIYA